MPPPPARRPGRLLAATAFGALAAGAALTGSIGTSKGVSGAWYLSRRKASFQPPPEAFAPVWTALYGLMAVAGYRLWRAPDTKGRTRALALWGAQLPANAVWSWLFFAWERPRLAAANLTALVALNAALVTSARQVDGVAAALLAPYLGWTAFALVLNAEIVRKNQA